MCEVEQVAVRVLEQLFHRGFHLRLRLSLHLWRTPRSLLSTAALSVLVLRIAVRNSPTYSRAAYFSLSRRARSRITNDACLVSDALATRTGPQCRWPV
jgi:hypothetical protein